MNVSLIVTTYNWKEALNLVLLSARRQTVPPLEIIVADDGSGPDTEEVIRRHRAEAEFPIIHSRQEDRGFRAARSRNLALARAAGEYVILIDGDVVIHKDFVEDHLKFARRGFFAQGGRVLLSEELTRKALEEEILDFHFSWRNLDKKKKAFHSEVLARMFNTKPAGVKGIRTCNFAFWADDALAVNGFNEDFTGWGREDGEFAARLLNNGVRRQNIRFHAITCHLHHPVRPLDSLPANDALLAETIEKKLVWRPNGLSNHLAGNRREAGGK